MIGGKEGADPASIVYDAIASAKAKNTDVLLCDTAGRLHNKKNLMNELGKISHGCNHDVLHCAARPDSKRPYFYGFRAFAG